MSIQPHADGRSSAADQRGKRGSVADLSPAGFAAFAWRVVVALAIIALAYILWRSIHVLLLIFAGVLFAVFLSALATWASQRTGMTYGRALLLVVIVVALSIAGLGWLLANRLVLQTQDLARQLPESIEHVRLSE